MKNKPVIVFICTLLFPFFLHSQDIKSDLQKIKENYEVKEFTATIIYTFISNGKVTDKAEALHIHSKGNYYFKIKDIEILNNSKCQLIANHFFKSISVMPAGKKNDYKEMAKIPVDTALKDVASYTYYNEGNETGRYTIELKKGKYSKADIYFDTKTHIISKLKLYVSNAFADGDADFENGILEVEYKNYDASISKTNKELLNETRFVTVTSGTTTLSPAYKQYELNDYLNIKAE